jgi:hypothetical protein
MSLEQARALAARRRGSAPLLRARRHYGKAGAVEGLR